MPEEGAIAALRETARRFADAEIAPRAAELDESEAFPLDLYRALAGLGLFGITVPEAMGGAEAGVLAYAVVMEELARGYDPRFKVNPPLRRDEDVHALRAALADGTIDIVATDHAPHPVEAKECTWAEAAFGMVGLESALSVVQQAVVESGLLGWGDVARVLSTAPAAIGRVTGYDQPLAVGTPANLALGDPAHRRSWSVDDLHGRSTNTPYLARELPGRIVTTVHRGVLTLDDGQLVEPEAVAAGHEEVARG